MPHAGVAFMVIVGVGLGAFLYYMFADNQQHQYGNQRGECNSPPPENPNSWTINQDENKTRRRKRSSVSTGKASCTICLTELADKEITQSLSCGHEFHKACITNWREHGQPEGRNTCPNCRKGMSASSVWN